MPLLAFAWLSNQAICQTSYQLQSAEMSIAGTSTLHKWESPVTQIDFKGSVVLKDNELHTIKDVKLTIPVLGIKSTKGKTMDKKTWEALKSEEHPNILCSLNTFDIKSASEDNYTISAKGDLTVAGSTQPLELQFTAKYTDTELLVFTGSKALKMTDFNVKPPKALLGTLKTGDEITIKFTVKMKSTDTSSDSR